MYFLAGIMGLIELVLLLIKLPFKKFPKNKKAKIDYIGSLLLTIGLLSIIVGLTSLGGTGFIPIYGCIILVIGGLGILIFYFYYNAKLSKSPIFNM